MAARTQLRSDYDWVFRSNVKQCSQQARETGYYDDDTYDACFKSEVKPAFDSADQTFKDAIESVMVDAGPDCRAALQRILLDPSDLAILGGGKFEDEVLPTCRNEMIQP